MALFDCDKLRHSSSLVANNQTPVHELPQIINVQAIRLTPQSRCFPLFLLLVGIGFFHPVFFFLFALSRSRINFRPSALSILMERLKNIDRTNLTAAFFFLLVIAAIIGLMLAFSLKGQQHSAKSIIVSTPPSHDSHGRIVCVTDGCKKIASYLNHQLQGENLNCTRFHDYVCGDEHDKDYDDHLPDTRKRNLKKLAEIMSNKILNFNSSILNLASELYSSCMDESKCFTSLCDRDCLNQAFKIPPGQPQRHARKFPISWQAWIM